jgi:hypothetical protein
MKRLVNILKHLGRTVLIVAVGSAIRIARGQGEGVFETAVQEAFAEVAKRYVRSVST